VLYAWLLWRRLGARRFSNRGVSLTAAWLTMVLPWRRTPEKWLRAWENGGRERAIKIELGYLLHRRAPSLQGKRRREGSGSAWNLAACCLHTAIAMTLSMDHYICSLSAYNTFNGGTPLADNGNIGGS